MNEALKVIDEKDRIILQALAEGKRYEEIGPLLSLSVYTVKYHVKKLLTKTGYVNTVSMVAHAVAYGVVKLS